MFRTKIVNNIKTNVLLLIRLFSENLVVNETTWKKNVTAGQDTDTNITRRVRFACWITEATNTSLEYLIF